MKRRIEKLEAKTMKKDPGVVFVYRDKGKYENHQGKEISKRELDHIDKRVIFIDWV